MKGSFRAAPLLLLLGVCLSALGCGTPEALDNGTLSRTTAADED